MQDERPYPRQAPDANANAASSETDDPERIPIRSQKMQTDQSYLKDKWRPNRTDFEEESNNVSVKSSQTDMQSKKATPIPSKPSQTDTSFLYDQYMRSRGDNKTQDSPSQTVLKQDLNDLGNIRYPTQYVPGMRGVSHNDETKPSEVAVTKTDKCVCSGNKMIVCPSKSMPAISDPNSAASYAFQSTCSKQSTQPSQDSTVWFSLESDTSNAACPAASKPIFCPAKSCKLPADKSMHAESMLSKCTCKSSRALNNFKSAQSSGYAPLDLASESNMQSARSKSYKCLCQSSKGRTNVKSTQSTQSLPCGEKNKSTHCVTVVYCPLRDYINGPTLIDVEMGPFTNDVSNDGTNWQSARSNISDPFDPSKSQDPCFCTIESNRTAATAWNSARSDLSAANPMEGNLTTMTPWNSVKSDKSCACGSGNPARSCACDSSNPNAISQPSNMCYLDMESNTQTATAWNSLKSDKSCGCDDISNQAPIETSKLQVCSRAIMKSDKNFGSHNVNTSNIVSQTETFDTSIKNTPTGESATPWRSLKSDKPCTCGSSNRSPVSKSSNSEQTTSRSRSVMAKVTCLCSSEQRADLGVAGRDGDAGPPFARVDESNLDYDISAADPCLVSAAGTDYQDGDEQQNYKSCYTPSQGTKVVFMKADGFCDCRSSTTSLTENAGIQDIESVEDSALYQDGETTKKSKSSSCVCSKAYNADLKSQTRSQNPSMKSAATCSCGKETVQDFKSTRSDKTSCSCNIKTSKYDDFSLEPESVGVVMDCDATVCVDKTTFDNLSAAASAPASARSQNSARDRLINMVDLVTSSKDASVNRADLAQQIIRELTLMLRKDEEDSKPPKLSYEDCLEAVQRGDRPVKKQDKTQADINRLQCLDRMEQYIETCFPRQKSIEVTEIGGFEIDPDFDPDGKSSSSSGPDIRESHLFRSCFTDVDARFMTPKGGSATPSTAESPGILKEGSEGKTSSADAGTDVMSDAQPSEQPEAASGVNGEPIAPSQPSDEPEASPLRGSTPKAPSLINSEPKAPSVVATEPKAPSMDGTEPKAPSTDSSEPRAPSTDSLEPKAPSGASLEPNGSPQRSAEPDGSNEVSQLTAGQPDSAMVCTNELCPEATSQGPKSNACQLCELDSNDPLSPLTDRERLLCEYLLRRMCELCDDDQAGEGYECEADGDRGGRSAPTQPCLCCHCRALVCDNQCKTVSKVLDSATYDPVAEMKFFIDSVVFDLQAMDHVMKKNQINPKAPKPSPCMGNGPGESFPVTITDVSSLGCRALYVRWELQDCSGVGGYEIYVDGHLTNRFYSHRHEAGVVSNVDVTKRHQIILRAQVIGQEFPGEDRGPCNAMTNAHPEMRVGAQQPWTPSVYFYEP
ncbi:hypothetical protein ACLKA7_008151 [Drosophila subpalustris]